MVIASRLVPISLTPARHFRKADMTIPFLRNLSRLTIASVLLATALPAQQTQYGPFRITAGRWHGVGLYMKKGEYFHVRAVGLVKYYNVQFGPDGFQLQNGNVAGKLHALSGQTTFAVGAANGAYAVVDGELDLGLLFAPQVNESDAVQSTGAFYVYVTTTTGKCRDVTCGFTNNSGSDLPGGTPTGAPGAGNVVTWTPNLQGIVIAGYQLANAEVGAMYGSGNALQGYVDGRLREAHQSAVTGRIDATAIAQLINSLAQSRNPNGMSSTITSVLNGYEQGIGRSCTCGGIASNPAWAFNAGRNMAYVEAAVSNRWDANTMYSSLSNLRTACVNSGIYQVSAIDRVMEALRMGYQPNNLPAPGLNGVRNEVFYGANRACVCY